MHGTDPDWNAVRGYAYPLLMEDFLRRTQLADPAMVEWAAPLVLAAQGDSRSTARQLRMAGEPLSVQERRERGFPPRLQIGRQFADALLARGMQDVEATALAISHYPFAMTGRGQMRWLCLHDRVQARMLIRDDEKTCLAARPYMKQIVPIAALPVFPLQDCDKLVCRCSFDRSGKADRRTRRPGPETLPEFSTTPTPTDTPNPAKPRSAFGAWFGRILKWVMLGPLIAILVFITVMLAINALRLIVGF